MVYLIDINNNKFNSNQPTTNRGDIASGANTITINTGLTVPVTVYAYAQASGKDPSDVVSLTL